MKKSGPAGPFGSVCGTATVGPRGQIVIPKEARKKLNLEVGDQLLVIEHAHKLMLIPEDMMRQMLEQVSEHFKPRG